MSFTPRIVHFSVSLLLLLVFSTVCTRADITPALGSYFDVRAFGAKGDGVAMDTDAINHAIAAAAQNGGGTVVFAPGVYKSYSIHLQSHVGLYLAHGATLLAADPPAVGQPGGYDAAEPNSADPYQDFGHSHWHNSLIWGENIEDISITGPGQIFGKGLSRGYERMDPLPTERKDPPFHHKEPMPGVPSNIVSGPFGYPSWHDTLPDGVGNKAIALKNCHNVILRDFTIFHGGHFGILAFATDNLTIENLRIDTNRDGMDIDACQNVRVTDCTVNSPLDDGICLKSCFGLGTLRATENVTVTGCQVSGFEEGSVIDGTRKRKGFPTGRIKLGTEANGGFKNVTVSNCVFEYSRGLALEEVDGGPMENIVVSNLSMHDIVNAPIFVRLGARLRGPNHPPIGTARRIIISDIAADHVTAKQGILLLGEPGGMIRDLQLHHIAIEFDGGMSKESGERKVPEIPAGYPEPSGFGDTPAYGIFARYLTDLSIDHVVFRVASGDGRPVAQFEEVNGLVIDHFSAPGRQASTFVLKNVAGLKLTDIQGLQNVDHPEPTAAVSY